VPESQREALEKGLMKQGYATNTVTGEQSYMVSFAETLRQQYETNTGGKRKL